MKIRVRVKPGARKDSIQGWDQEGILSVSIREQPRMGKANRALVELLAVRLQIPKGDISLLHGKTSRLKTLRIVGLNLEELRRRLGV